MYTYIYICIYVYIYIHVYTYVKFSHQPSVNAQLFRRVVEQALHIVSFAFDFVETSNFFSW